MAPDDTDERKPSAPAVLRVKLRYNSVEAMVNRFAPNVGKLGIFIPTKQVYPPGTEIKFELRLATDVPMLVGLGRVMSSHEPDPNNPRAVFGIGIEIIRVTREGRQLLVRLIERRRAMGLPNVAIPIPADIDAARRADIDTQPRAQIPTPGNALLIQQNANVLTAPRVAPVPLAGGHESAERGAILALTPEPARPPRRRLADVIAAAHPAAALSDDQAGLLDSEVDVASTLARARALASGDLDNELARLRDSSAAPLVDIEIEAASAELARHLGGAAVKRDRSAPVVAPSVVSAHPAAAASDRDSAPIAGQLADGSEVRQLDSIMAAASSNPAPSEDAVPGSSPDRRRELKHTAQRRLRNPSAIRPAVPRFAAETATVVEEPTTDSAAAPDSVPAAEPRSIAEASGPVVEPPPTVEASGPVLEPPPAVEPPPTVEPPPAVETASSVVGPLPPVDAAGSTATPESPPAVDGSDSAAAEDDDPDLLSFERALDAARVQTGVTHTPAPPAPHDNTSEEDDDEDVDELDDSELEHLRVRTPPVGIAVSPAATVSPEPTAIPQTAPPTAPPPAIAGVTAVRNADGVEVSDVDVLAEADEEDDDLLHAHLRRDELIHSAPQHAPSAPEFLDPAELSAPIRIHAPVAEPIAARADSLPRPESAPLPSGAYAHYEQAEAIEDHYEDAHYEHAHYEAPPAYVSKDVNRQYPDDFDYDFAARLDLDDDDSAHTEDGGSYTFADRISPGNVASPAPTFDEPYGLEDALSNLDADSEVIDPASDRRRVSQTRRPPLPGMPAERTSDFGAAQAPRSRRFVTEDGVIIDFDDDDES